MTLEVADPSPHDGRIMRVLFSGLAVIGLSLAALPVAEAKQRKLESRAQDIDLKTIRALLETGEVALIETTPEGRSKQVVLFAMFDATPERLWDVLMDVERYPTFLKNVDDVKIVGKKKGMIAFSWHVDLPFFDLKGERMQRGLRPNLIELRGKSGHLRGSRERWELHASDGGKKTLAVFYRAVDVETGGLVLETMVKLEPSMEQATNLSTGFVHIRQLQAYLRGEKLSTPKARTGPVPPFKSLNFESGDLKASKLAPLLKHGQLALIQSHADGALAQVIVMAQSTATPKRFAEVVQDPARYPEFLGNFAEQNVTKLEDNRLQLDWELEVPLKNLEGRSVMQIETDGSVDVVAQSGDIKRGRWRWEFVSFGDTSLPVHYAYSDVREASWVTRKIVEAQPLFEHGMVIAATTVAMTGMKARAEGLR